MAGLSFPSCPRALSRQFSVSVESVRRIVLALFLLPLSLAVLSAQPEDTPDGDSLSVDSAAVAAQDSIAAIARADTLPPLLHGGVPPGSVRPYATGFVDDLHKEELNQDLYFSLFGPLHRTLPALPMSQGTPGRVRTFSYAGSGPPPVLFNGRPLNGFEAEMYSPEFFEQVEILRGADAALYGGSDALLALNIVPPMFDVAGSYMRLAWAQGNNSTNSDVSYARNITSRTNLAVGLRSMSGDGDYTNEAVSFWSARGALTWRPTERLNISLAELFTDLTRGANGGLTSASAASPGFAEVQNDSLRESTLRHDITLGFQWYPGASDSTATKRSDGQARVDGALYYSHAERRLEVDEDVLAEISGIRSRTSADRTGVRVGGFLPLGQVRMHANGVADIVNGESGRIHAGGMAELVLADSLRLFAGAALTSENDVASTTLFAEGRLVPVTDLALRLTARAMNSDAEAAQGSVWSLERTGLFIEAEAAWKPGRSVLRVGGGLRQVPASAQTGEEYTLITGNLSATIPFAFLSFEENVTFTSLPADDKRFPAISSRSDLFGLFQLFGGNLDLRTGASLEVQTSFAGSEYDYVSGLWIYPQDAAREERGLYPLLNVYAQGRIGSAYLKIEMSNILGSEYYTIYRYPYPGRSLRLGITWALID